MKRFKFELGGSYIYFTGYTMGEAIEAFIHQRPNRVAEITQIVEEPYKSWELP